MKNINYANQFMEYLELPWDFKENLLAILNDRRKNSLLYEWISFTNLNNIKDISIIPKNVSSPFIYDIQIHLLGNLEQSYYEFVMKRIHKDQLTGYEKWDLEHQLYFYNILAEAAQKRLSKVCILKFPKIAYVDKRFLIMENKKDMISLGDYMFRCNWVEKKNLVNIYESLSTAYDKIINEISKTHKNILQYPLRHDIRTRDIGIETNEDWEVLYHNGLPTLIVLDPIDDFSL